MDQGSSLLLGIEGLVVDRVLIDDVRSAGGALLDRPGVGGVVPGVPAAVVVAEGAGDDPAAGCADRTGSASVVVAQTEMALPGAGVRAEGVHRGAARARSRRGPGSPPGPAGRRRVSIGDHLRPVSGVAAEFGHGLADRARRVRRLRRAGAARPRRRRCGCSASTRPAAGRAATRSRRRPG